MHVDLLKKVRAVSSSQFSLSNLECYRDSRDVGIPLRASTGKLRGPRRPSGKNADPIRSDPIRKPYKSQK